MDPFEILGAPRRFDLDLAVIEKTHRELSRALHPDRFSQAGASERRAALEKAATVNEAFRVLRDPIKRAEALFRLAGWSVDEGSAPKASGEFLMDMMEQREELAEARAKKDLAKVRALGERMRARVARVEGELTRAFGGDGGRESVGTSLHLLGELRFYKRFLSEVAAIEEEAEEAAAQVGAG